MESGTLVFNLVRFLFYLFYLAYVGHIGWRYQRERGRVHLTLLLVALAFVAPRVVSCFSADPFAARVPLESSTHTLIIAAVYVALTLLFFVTRTSFFVNS